MPERAGWPDGFPLRPVAALSRTNCHLELSRPFCRHIAYLSARRSNGVPEIMPRALNKTVKGPKSARTVKAKTARRVIKPWTKEDVRTLKAHSKARTPVTKVSKVMKRTVGALRRRAGILGVGLGHRR